MSRILSLSLPGIVFCLALPTLTAMDEGGSGLIVLPITSVSATKTSTSATLPTSLTIRATALQCTGCQSFSQTPATCCGKVTTPQIIQLPTSPIVDLKAGTIGIKLGAGQMVKLSAIDKALGGIGQRINRATMTVPNYARFTVGGVSSESSAQKLRTTAAILQTHQKPSVTWVGKKQQAQLVIGPATAAGTSTTLKAFSSAIQSANAQFKTLDVAFVGTCPACLNLGKTQASCSHCWQGLSASL
jgi:hypothetical protein